MPNASNVFMLLLSIGTGEAPWIQQGVTGFEEIGEEAVSRSFFVSLP